MARSSIASFLVFNFLIAPACLFFICLALGTLLALIEEWRVVDGFYFIACDVTGTVPFFSPKRDVTTFGEIMEIVISIIALTAASSVVGLSALMSLSSDLPHQLGIVNSPLRGVLTIFILIPIFVLLFCFVLGSLFAALEGWPVMEGFLFLVQTICSLNDPLTERIPESEFARFVALAIAIAALGITSVIVGLVGAMAICEETVALIEVKLGICFGGKSEEEERRISIHKDIEAGGSGSGERIESRERSSHSPLEDIQLIETSQGETKGISPTNKKKKDPPTEANRSSSKGSTF